ncbi:MAG: hypothetical protein AB8B49_02065, partial [Nitratireductor sp.]
MSALLATQNLPSNKSKPLVDVKKESTRPIEDAKTIKFDPASYAAKQRTNASKKSDAEKQNENAHANHIEDLFNIEASIRKAGKLAELKYLLANETKKLVGAKQVFIHKLGKKNTLSKIETVSSLATVDPHAPMLIALNNEINEHVQNAENEEEKTLFRIKTKSNATGEYPFSYVLQLSIKNRNGKDLAAISFLKEMPFQEREIVLAKRLVETGAHAWSALKPRRFSVSNFFSKPISITLCLIALMILFIPVSLRVLAPVEIVPHKPLIV